MHVLGNVYFLVWLGGLGFCQLRSSVIGTPFSQSTYRFPLTEAEQILGKHRSQVITYGEEILRQVQRGDLESWQQLQAQDLAFMRSLAREL